MKNVIAILALVIGLGFGTAVQAGEEFACVTTNHKLVKVYSDSNGFEYVIYKKDADTPELIFTNPDSKVRYDWLYSRVENSVGGVLEMRNGAYVYTVSKFEKEGVVRGDIIVTKGNKTLATLECIPGSVKGDLDSPEGKGKLKSSDE